MHSLECSQALQQEKRDRDEDARPTRRPISKGFMAELYGGRHAASVGQVIFGGDSRYAAGDKKGDTVNFLFSTVLLGQWPGLRTAVGVSGRFNASWN